MPKKSIQDATGNGERVPTGVPGLDPVLRGGFPAVGGYLLKGRPGCGKTTFALHFLREGVRRGERTLMLSFGQTRRVLERTAASFGWNLDGIDIYAPSAGEIADTLGQPQTVFSSGETELPRLTGLIRERIEAHRPPRVVFDSLSLVQALATRPGSYRRELMGLVELFHDYATTVLFTVVDEDRFSSAEAEAFLDGVVALRRVPVEFGAQRFELRVEKLRGSGFRGGSHDFGIGSEGVVVHPRWEPDGAAGEPGRSLSSGRVEIDALLGGGLRTGTSTLVTGPSGTGKTTLMTLYVHAAAERGQRSALFLFDQGREAFLTQSGAVGVDLRPHVAAGRVAVEKIESRSFMPGEFAGRVRAAAESGAAIVGIDSLSTYFHAANDPALLRAQFTDLLDRLRERDLVTFMTLAQPGVFGQGVATPYDVSEIADTVLLLRYFEARGALLRALSVVKKRYGDHEKTIRALRISADGIHVGDATHDFSGVLTGNPEFTGAKTEAESGAAPERG